MNKTIVFPFTQSSKKIPINLLILLFLSFLIIGCSQSSPIKLDPVTDQEPLDPELKPDAQSHRLFGAYTYGGIWGGMTPIYELEANLGQRLDIVHWFSNWEDAWDENLVSLASQAGRLPMISWESHHVTPEGIASGAVDNYISSWAQGVKAHEGLVYLRPFPEMNGDWTPWHGDPEALVAAWQHIVKLFDQEGADNVRWVWAPNITDQPAIATNRMENYYPGDVYVDILALDGYNWGTTRPWSQWQSFEALFYAPYERIAKLGQQPIWLTEVASAEEGGDKAAWVEAMLSSSAFPRLEAFVWFNEAKEASWNMDSSDAVLTSFQIGLSDIQFAGR